MSINESQDSRASFGDIVNEHVPVKKDGHRQLFLVCLVACAAGVLVYGLILIIVSWVGESPLQKVTVEQLDKISLPSIFLCQTAMIPGIFNITFQPQQGQMLTLTNFSVNVFWNGGTASCAVIGSELDPYPSSFSVNDKYSSMISGLPLDSDEAANFLTYMLMDRSEVQALSAANWNFSDPSVQYIQSSLFSVPLGAVTQGWFTQRKRIKGARTEITYDFSLVVSPFSPQYLDGPEYARYTEGVFYLSAFNFQAKSFTAEVVEDVYQYGFSQWWAAVASVLTAASYIIGFLFPLDIVEKRHFRFGDQAIPKHLKSPIAQESDDKEEDLFRMKPYGRNELRQS
jgi:hypothetical protein